MKLLIIMIYIIALLLASVYIIEQGTIFLMRSQNQYIEILKQIR